MPGPFWCKMTVVIVINEMVLIVSLPQLLNVILNKHILRGFRVPVSPKTSDQWTCTIKVHPEANNCSF